MTVDSEHDAAPSACDNIGWDPGVRLSRPSLHTTVQGGRGDVKFSSEHGDEKFCSVLWPVVHPVGRLPSA